VTRPGIYYGQCSEICGVNHGFMPISIKAVPAQTDGFNNIPCSLFEQGGMDSLLSSYFVPEVSDDDEPEKKETPLEKERRMRISVENHGFFLFVFGYVYGRSLEFVIRSIIKNLGLDK
jgi:hypothetical protein